VSSAYQDEGKWEMRIWGWIPRERDSFRLPAGLVRNNFMADLRAKLTSKCFWDCVFGPDVVDPIATANSWRECADGDGKGFLEVLLD
jgi:hypothetical protein